MNSKQRRLKDRAFNRLNKAYENAIMPNFELMTINQIVSQFKDSLTIDQIDQIEQLSGLKVTSEPRGYTATQTTSITMKTEDMTREELIEALKNSQSKAETLEIQIELHNRAMKVRGTTYIPQFDT